MKKDKDDFKIKKSYFLSNKKNKENLDIDRFSAKNKKIGQIYFLKEKSNKKTDNTDSESSTSKEIKDDNKNKKEGIIFEIDNFLAKFPNDTKTEKIEDGEVVDENEDGSIEEFSDDGLDDEDVVDSGKHGEEGSKIEGLMVDEVADKVDEGEAGLVDKKIRESSEIDESIELERDVGEVKAVELAEKHRFFGRKKVSKVEDKEEVVAEERSGVKSESVDKVKIEDTPSNISKPLSKDIDKLEKKYEGRFSFSGLTPIEQLNDEIKQDESSLLDKKISETPLNKEIKDEKITSDETKLKKPKKKKSFFKRKKIQKLEEVKEQEKRIEPKKWKGNLRFHVDNIPKTGEVSEKEAKLLDENIKTASKSTESKEKKDFGEIKAIKLAEEHLKNRSLSVEKEASFSGQSNIQKDNNINEFSKSLFDSPQENKDLEHAFFDETDVSSEGWSPQVIEKDKKDVLSPLPEISPSDIELPKDVLKTKSIKLSDLGFSDKEWEELDYYSLNEPFAFVEILREKETLDKRYFLVQIELTEEEQRILEFITETLGKLTINPSEVESDGEDKYLMKKINQIVDDYDIRIDAESKAKILYYFKGTSLGLDKIDALMKDPHIEDISCDGAKVPIFLYHRKYGSLKSNIEFKDEDELSSFVVRLAQKCGKHISIAEPMLDATMPDGSRIQMTLSDEVTSKGSTFTIRKFREDPFSPPDLIEFNTMSSEMVAYMWLAIEHGVNTLIAGGTASGKTTALNALSLFIPRESKIVSIEETREINLPHPNWIPGVARSGFGEIMADKIIGEIDLYDLMKAALRQRPEYILVGEIRGREAYVLFQAMATGHATYSTVHADSTQSLIHRLEGKPINIPRVMLQSLDIITLHIITRVKNKRARRCKQIIEIIDIDPSTKEILTNEVFRWDPVEDKFIYSGKSYILERIRAEKDFSREKMTEEIKNRAEILEWMNKNNVRQFKDVAKIVSHYIEAPSELLKNIKRVGKQ